MDRLEDSHNENPYSPPVEPLVRVKEIGSKPVLGPIVILVTTLFSRLPRLSVPVFTAGSTAGDGVIRDCSGAGWLWMGASELSALQSCCNGGSFRSFSFSVFVFCLTAVCKLAALEDAFYYYGDSVVARRWVDLVYVS